MTFQKVQDEKLAGAIVRQIELLILRGILRPGERLPSERELSERMGVSRPSLREAVAELEARGLLVTRAGSGIYVDEGVGAHYPPALMRLFSTHDEAVFDYIAFRRDIEGIAVERAARTGSDTDLKVVDAIFRKMEAAQARGRAEEEAALDAQFHMAIIEASHNVVMLHVMRGMFDLLSEGVFFNRRVMFKQRATGETLLDQHRTINAALQRRDADGARAAVVAHLDFVERALIAQRKAERNEEIARLRFAHQQER
jgi:GntR family transcriptional repressor for pyruvate dehydrogenase complex